MEKINQLNKLIEQTCSDSHNEPPLKHYQEILTVIESRVDMPKHTITAISKRLATKNKKALYICFDLLEYLSYNLELPFFNQIATKEFLFKISGLMTNKDTDPVIMDKILKIIRCFDELFRPLEDFLPLFFQFEAGVLRKQFQIPFDYVSPYRPKELKVYKKPEVEAKKQAKKPVVKPSSSQKATFQEIRQKILLTNEIFDNCDPSDQIKHNEIALEMMEEMKKCEKIINQTINQNPSEAVMQLALASNDDLYITYRRYKDLQRNKKPEPFVMAELESDIMREKQQSKIRSQAKQTQSQAYRTQVKAEQPSSTTQLSIFDLVGNSSTEGNSEVKASSSSKIQSPAKKEPQNIFDLDLGDQQPESKPSDITQVTQAVELMDLTQTQLQDQNQSQPSSANQVGNVMDLLGQYATDVNQNFNPQSSSNQNVYSTQGPQMDNNVPSNIFDLAGSQGESQDQNQGSAQSSYQTQPNPNFGNITLETTDNSKKEQNVNMESYLTNLGDFKEMFTTTNNQQNQS